LQRTCGSQRTQAGDLAAFPCERNRRLDRHGLQRQACAPRVELPARNRPTKGCAWPQGPRTSLKTQLEHARLGPLAQTAATDPCFQALQFDPGFQLELTLPLVIHFAPV